MARDVYQEITDKIIAQLEAGVRPWAQPWKNDGSVAPSTASPLPRRVTGEYYRGINIFLLWIAQDANGYRSTTWMTFNQAKALGGMVRKGETGTFICYASKIAKKAQDATGKEVDASFFMMKGYTVFNVDQIDGLPAKFATQVEAPAPVVNAEGRIEAVDAF